MAILQPSSYLENLLDFQRNLVEEGETKMVAGKRNHEGLKMPSLLRTEATTWKPQEKKIECNVLISSVCFDKLFPSLIGLKIKMQPSAFEQI